MRWFRRRRAEEAEEVVAGTARLEGRIAELEAQLDARERELAAAYADVDAASAELARSAEAVREALAVIEALEGGAEGKSEEEAAEK